MKLTDIIKGTEYDLSLFSDKHIAELENCIVERNLGVGSHQGIHVIHRLLLRKDRGDSQQ